MECFMGVRTWLHWQYNDLFQIHSDSGKLRVPGSWHTSYYVHITYHHAFTHTNKVHISTTYMGLKNTLNLKSCKG